jgi:hypothetical protein
MAKVSGPLHSDSASGSIGQGITFRTLGSGGTHARPRKASINRITQGMSLMNISADIASRAWGGLTDAQRSDWEYRARAIDQSGYQYFMQVNIPRIHAGLPILEWPPGWPIPGE